MTDKVELDKLFAFVMTYAQGWLAKESALLPFGATMGADGECAHLFMSPEGAARPIREALAAALREKTATGAFRAVALCVEVVIAREGESKFDAVMVYLEHSRGLALEVVTPYIRTPSGEAAYAPPRASRGVPNTFFSARAMH